MTRIPVLTIAMMTVASAALAQSNPNPGAVPNTGVSPVGPTYSAPGNQGGATPSPGMGGTFTGPGGTTGASPSVPARAQGADIHHAPSANSNTQQPPNSRHTPSSTPVPPNSNAGHPPDETRTAPPTHGESSIILERAERLTPPPGLLLDRSIARSVLGSPWAFSDEKRQIT